MPHPLKPGSKIHFVSINPKLSNDELIKKAKASGMGDITRSQINIMRWTLRNKYGIDMGPPKPRELKNPPSTSSSIVTAAPAEALPAKVVKRKYTAKANKKQLELALSPMQRMKEEKFFQLVFELGYDRIQALVIEAASRMRIGEDHP